MIKHVRITAKKARAIITLLLGSEQRMPVNGIEIVLPRICKIVQPKREGNSKEGTHFLSEIVYSTVQRTYITKDLPSYLIDGKYAEKGYVLWGSEQILGWICSIKAKGVTCEIVDKVAYIKERRND